ncbi:MAG: flagellar FlbD family protein [Firmicutes bacterium]|jgi:flagellar protein FlbD|nr:flagellar FlbD family protein [Bacillota bacterium]MDH7495392.1 flagellar FlbD family protein [Bacillota bacterium]
MIRVHRLDGSEIVVNADLIETIEATPDTIITLTTGKKLVVRDAVDEVVAAVVAHKRAIALGQGIPDTGGAART